MEYKPIDPLSEGWGPPHPTTSLGWKKRHDFKNLVKEMAACDLAAETTTAP